MDRLSWFPEFVLNVSGDSLMEHNTFVAYLFKTSFNEHGYKTLCLKILQLLAVSSILFLQDSKALPSSSTAQDNFLHVNRIIHMNTLCFFLSFTSGH